VANGEVHQITALKAWANAIGIVGIPGSIAIFLVYIGATEIPKLVRTGELAVAEIRQTRDLLREHIEQTNMLIRVTQRTCSNSAKDENARQNCFDK
jgi:hypothetical protein